MSGGTALIIVGTALLSYLPSDGHQVKAQYGYEVLLGLGLGMTVSTATFMNSMEVEFVDHGMCLPVFQSSTCDQLTIPAVAQGTVAQSRIFGGAIGIAVSTIVMNNHVQDTLEGVVSSDVLQSLYKSPFTITQYGVSTEALFRESYIRAFSQDMKISMYVAIVAFVVSICAWQRHPPTVQERSELLAAAVKEYKGRKAATEEVRNEV